MTYSQSVHQSMKTFLTTENCETPAHVLQLQLHVEELDPIPINDECRMFHSCENVFINKNIIACFHSSTSILLVIKAQTHAKCLLVVAKMYLYCLS
jgi:hypothetical protein